MEHEPEISFAQGVPDEALLAAIAVGDRAALALLYDRYGAVLLAIGQRMLRSEREAEDLLHDVFLEVWRYAADYDASRGSVRSWLVMRMRSRALDRLKSVAYSRVVSLETVSIPEPATPEVDPSFLQDQQIRDALRQLPADQRWVLEQAYFEGFSLSEIAARQEAPLGTIKSRLARALTRLREILQHLREQEP
ncbi:MAG: sigma-70 family RNA polymerase sigma factor [Myxococcales bacterium]|nr:sigma-70 family RNA polymerase sigma factor [Polyangiaceae bacterium]MDW8250056.1 sigma-70 family RNA polymerase sigma factor [Myxococcales bacterium]